MIRRLQLDLPQLRLLASGVVGEASVSSEEELEAIPPVLLSLLDQAQAQGGEGPYLLELEAAEADRLHQVMAAQLDVLAMQGDLFALAELESLLSQLAG